MRLPKTLNPRIQKQLLMRFGVYEKVYPVETTPSRVVPDHIERPEYALGKQPVAPVRTEIKDINQIRGMRWSCKLAATILSQVEKFVKPGITTDEIDEFVHNLCIEAGAYPSPLHYKGFPKSVCTSVNNVAVHGIPDLRPLLDGDIVNVDITVYFKGFHGDCSKTFLIGDVDDKGQQLVEITEDCRNIVSFPISTGFPAHGPTEFFGEKGIKRCGPDVPFCEIGAVIHRHAKRSGLTVLPAFCGHGIGQYFHGPPDIFHTCLMKPGMTFTIEPVLTHGIEMTVLLDDGWTIITTDGARTAQCEHTVLVTEDGAEVLTK